MGIQIFQGVARQRAPLVGEMRKLENRIQTDQVRLEELRRKIAVYDEVLQEQNVDVDPDQYAPVTPTKRRAYFAHGQLLGSCLDALRIRQCPLCRQQVDLSNKLNPVFPRHKDVL